MSQTGWLETIDITIVLQFQKARVQNQSSGKAMLLLKPLDKDPSFSLPVSHRPSHSLVRGSKTAISTDVFTQPSSLYILTLPSLCACLCSDFRLL